MALYTKQDFSPPVLSRKWIAMKFRPNMLIYCRHHVIEILESGLMFREDSIAVEQEAPAPEAVWRAAGGGRAGWLTRGEAAVALAAVAVCVAAFPPKSLHRSSLLNLAAYLSVPVAIRTTHRSLARGTLASLLASMRDYLALARRAAACLKEYAALHAQLGSVSSCIESTHAMLRRQQSELSVSMSRACSTLLGNAPWLRGDVAWDALTRTPDDSLMKIHHAFLVVQSTLLKNIAMAHFVPPAHAQRAYKNRNERIYWLHNVLIQHLNEEFKENYEALERMYRLLRNFGSNESSDVKKPGSAVLDSWVYSEIHNGVARTNLELKFVSNKCNTLDAFLDSCALHKQDLDLAVLEKDLDEIIDDIAKCLSTVQNSQIRLKKIRTKVLGVDKDVRIEQRESSDEESIVKIDDRVPEVKDEVFYLLKTEDDDVVTPVSDVTTAPGKKEKETTKIVLKELKRKLGKREDVMRERERQALVKTMPELRDQVPEFPRQIKFEEYVVRRGFLSKTKRDIKKHRLFRDYKIQKLVKAKKYKFVTSKYENEDDIPKPYYEANAKLNFKSKLVTVSPDEHLCVTKWTKILPVQKTLKELDSSGLSEGLSDVEAGTANKAVHHAVNNLKNGHDYEAKNFTFSKKDLELSSSSSESDFEFYKEKQLALLKDIRRHRAARRKNHPDKRASIDKSTDKEDESMKPIEYNFGTGLAMASVLQINSKAKIPNLVQEEVFMGDGEVSNDSGNDEDA